LRAAVGPGQQFAQRRATQSGIEEPVERDSALCVRAVDGGEPVKMKIELDEAAN
jgi:hypothetical protein